MKYIESLSKFYPFLQGSECRKLTGGLINSTWLAENDGTKYVIQLVSPIFKPQVSNDVMRITSHLASKGLRCFKVIPEKGGNSYCMLDGHSFRVIEFLDGSFPTEKMAFECGEHLARFHGALVDFPHNFENIRVIHDTYRHLENMHLAVETHKDHKLYPEAREMAELIKQEILPFMPTDDTKYVLHGDPKPENFLVSDAGITLIDLDTCGHHDFDGECGDALRAFSNSNGKFDVAAFGRFISGYNSARTPNFPVLDLNAPFSIMRITLELASRFCADSLNESYFGWDENSFPTRGHHNLARCKDQFNFAMEVKSTLF
ncbi:phosphotransferase [Myxococcota bacterium]|nr:phosphotransferase [Myxococcota bacterium]MBU1380771.1 phosphotransferase [Myxococcota bacterium]MBU1498905.1 phosphotransferase [Myxococcota bacterium]